MVQYIGVSHNILGKSVPEFKGRTTRKKPVPEEGDLIQVPEELVNLYKDIYLTENLLFVNIIPFFLALIREICFTAVNHLANKKVETIFKAFK